MSDKKQKLELTWIGKEKRPRLEPRVLVEDAAKSPHAATRSSPVVNPCISIATQSAANMV